MGLNIPDIPCDNKYSPIISNTENKEKTIIKIKKES